jgi:predicted transcriptional regulator
MEESDIIKPEHVQDGEIDAIVQMTDEIEIEKVDFATLAYNMSFVYSNIPDIDVKQLSLSEQAKIEKMKVQILKLLVHAMDELHKEYFPKKKKND